MKSSRLTSTGKVKISINVPERYLNQLDQDRKRFNQDRSTWVTGSIMDKLASIERNKKIDGDEKEE